MLELEPPKCTALATLVLSVCNLCAAINALSRVVAHGSAGSFPSTWSRARRRVCGRGRLWRKHGVGAKQGKKGEAPHSQINTDQSEF